MIALAVWLVVSIGSALAIGRAIRIADNALYMEEDR